MQMSLDGKSSFDAWAPSITILIYELKNTPHRKRTWKKRSLYYVFCIHYNKLNIEKLNTMLLKKEQ